MTDKMNTYQILDYALCRDGYRLYRVFCEAAKNDPAAQGTANPSHETTDAYNAYVQHKINCPKCTKVKK